MASGVAVAAAIGFGGSGPRAADPAASTTPATTKVIRQALVDSILVEGELGYGEDIPVEAKGEGTVTWLPAEGAALDRGAPLLRVDNRPVVLLYGELPMYRRLAVATASGTGTGTGTGTAGNAGTGAAASPSATPVVPLRGPDVHQFESNLAALGYSGFTVDSTYTAQTAKAVRRWQRDLGRPVTGAVEIGDVVYAPGPIRIAHHVARVGAAAGGQVLAYNRTTKVVTVSVQVADSSWAVKGTKVTVTLPDAAVVPGVVSSVGTQASSDTGGEGGQGTDSGAAAQATLPVVISVTNQKALGRLDRAPVDVRYVAQRRDDVLTVPVAALLALAEEGYGVEVVEAGRARILAVRTGMFADGRVEIDGPGIREGQQVGIPQ